MFLRASKEENYRAQGVLSIQHPLPVHRKPEEASWLPKGLFGVFRGFP